MVIIIIIIIVIVIGSMAFHYNVTCIKYMYAKLRHTFAGCREQNKHKTIKRRTCGMVLTSCNHLTRMLQSLEWGQTRNIFIKLYIISLYNLVMQNKFCAEKYLGATIKYTQTERERERHAMPLKSDTQRKQIMKSFALCEPKRGISA